VAHIGQDDEQRSYAELVQESGEALLTIINDVLDISKLEAGKVDLEAIAFELADTLDGAIALLAPRAPQRKSNSSCRSILPRQSAIWAIPIVSPDPAQPRMNAIKFTDAGA